MKKTLLTAITLFTIAGMQAVPIATEETQRMRVDPTPFQEPTEQFEQAHLSRLGLGAGPRIHPTDEQIAALRAATFVPQPTDPQPGKPGGIRPTFGG